MLPIITFLLAASRKSSRLLYRDYFELEQIQHSIRPATDFVMRSEKKISEILERELSKYPNSSLIYSDSDIDTSKEMHFAIHPIDGSKNLTRAIPFFGNIILAYECKNSTLSHIASVVNMPALGEIIYASKGGGVWTEKNIDQTSNNAIRLRVSMTNKIDSAMVLLDASSKINTTDFADYRNIGCDIYSACMVAAGKADIFLSCSNMNKTILNAASMIVKESGGSIYENHSIHNKEYNFIAFNGKVI